MIAHGIKHNGGQNKFSGKKTEILRDINRLDEKRLPPRMIKYHIQCQNLDKSSQFSNGSRLLPSPSVIP
jgi:hypothetical protein